jgi:hypothetical protein
MKMPIVAGLIVTIVLLGCSVQVKVNEKSETDMGSHHVVVTPGSTFTSSSSFSGGDTETYQYTCGDVSVEIKNEELIVNNVRYGGLTSGVDVLIDHGAVLVGGEKREGTPMTPQDIMDTAPVKETTKDLTGYAVTVRPGSSFTSSTEAFGKHTLTVGKTKVSIKNDELFVNGTSFGNLTEGDTVLVEQGSVSVSGQVREPTK